MSKVMDVYMAYKFIKILTTPWNKTSAYKLGLIDEKGKKLKSPETSEESDAYNHFNRLVFNIKRILSKAPGGKSSLASYGAALLLLKEAYKDELEDKNMFENLLKKHLEEEGEAPTNIASQIPKKDMPLGKKKKKKESCQEQVEEIVSDMDNELRERIEENLDAFVSLAVGFSVDEECETGISKVLEMVREGKVFKKVVRNKKIIRKAFCSNAGQHLSQGKCVNKDAAFRRSEKKSVRKRKKTLKGKSINRALRKRALSLKKRNQLGK